MIKNKSFWFIAIIITYYTAMHYNSQHATIDKTYIINLDSNISRYQMMQKKLESIKLEVPYDKFNAIDGRAITFFNKATHKTFSGKDILEHKIWLKGDFDIRCQGNEDPADYFTIKSLNQESYNRRIPGEMGCTCSHAKIWQDIVEGNYQNVLIMEDDLRFIPFFNRILTSAMNNAPKDYELLFLHYRNYGEAFDRKENNALTNFFDTYIKNFFWKRAYTNLVSSRGYVLSNNGAKKLLQCLKNDSASHFMSIDFYMNKCLNDGNIIAYASKPKFIYNDNIAAEKSDISELESVK